MKEGECILSSPTVSQVIDAYYGEFDTGKQANIISKGFEVQNISINGGTENENSVVPFGGQLHIAMDCHVSAKCKKIQLKIVVWNIEQRPVLEILSEDFQPYTWDNDSENSSLSVVIPSLRLTGGKYSIVIWAADPEKMDILCRIVNAATFIMGHHLSTASELLHPARWSRQ